MGEVIDFRTRRKIELPEPVSTSKPEQPIPGNTEQSSTVEGLNSETHNQLLEIAKESIRFAAEQLRRVRAESYADMGGEAGMRARYLEKARPILESVGITDSSEQNTILNQIKEEARKNPWS